MNVSSECKLCCIIASSYNINPSDSSEGTLSEHERTILFLPSAREAARCIHSKLGCVSRLLCEKLLYGTRVHSMSIPVLLLPALFLSTSQHRIFSFLFFTSLDDTHAAVNAFTTGNPFWGGNLLEHSIGRDFGCTQKLFFSGNPFLGTNLLEHSVGRDFGCTK